MKKFILLFVLSLFTQVNLFALQFTFPVATQMDYRWRNDDGSESTATWKAAQTTTIILSDYSNVRLRIEVHGMMTPGASSSNLIWLQYSNNNSSWTTITSSGNNFFQLALSDNIAESDILTKQLYDGPGGFGGGKIIESTSPLGFSISEDEYEFEYCIKPTSNCINGTYYFRIGFNGSSSYIATPQATMNLPTIIFTDGTSFSTNISKGDNDQALGRFQLNASSIGTAFTTSEILLNGTRTGLSNFKLWCSSDETFDNGSDTKLGSTVVTDPGDGNSITFSGFNRNVPTVGDYYFVTADVATEATGSIEAVLVENTSLSVTGGYISNSINIAELSASTTALPVELTSFTAVILNNQIELSWQTATEINNYGFEIERKKLGVKSEKWEKIGFINGHGNSNSPKFYKFSDNNPSFGNINYRLKQIDFDGVFEYSDVVEISFIKLQNEITLEQNYPNPFNPTTKIVFSIPHVGDTILASQMSVILKVYDILGNEIVTLVNENKRPGNHEVVFNASNFASGIYYYQLSSGNFIEIKKMILMK